MHHIIFLTLLIMAGSVNAADLSIENRCDFLAKKHIEHFKKEQQKDYSLIEIESFYSKKEDSCILIEKKLVGVGIQIRDLSKSIILDGGKHFNMLLNCSIDGVDSVVLDKVRLLKGRVFNVNYQKWLDNGFGGSPRTLKTPPKSYTKKDCDMVLQKWLSTLK